MTKSIVRAFWGINDASIKNRIIGRKFNVDKKILQIKHNPYCKNFITYVWGKDNYSFLKNMGFKCELVYDKPYQWDLVKFQYRHKLEALKIAMKSFDKILFVDWDCVPIKEEDQEMWDILDAKQAFQANLVSYKKAKALWRKTYDQQNKIPNAGCVYMADKNIPQKIISIWEKNMMASAEPPMAKYCDEITGGWKGLEKYWEMFEILICNTHKMSPYAHNKQKQKQKNLYFIHYQGERTIIPNETSK